MTVNQCTASATVPLLEEDMCKVIFLVHLDISPETQTSHFLLAVCIKDGKYSYICSLLYCFASRLPNLFFHARLQKKVQQWMSNLLPPSLRLFSFFLYDSGDDKLAQPTSEVNSRSFELRQASLAIGHKSTFTKKDPSLKLWIVVMKFSKVLERVLKPHCCGMNGRTW